MKKFNDILISVVHILEKIIAMILIVVVLLASVYMVKEICGELGKGFDNDFLREALANAFNIIIVIEFVRVLIKHTMGTVIETLIFALARGLIVENEKIWEMSITIVAIVLLLAARKYLFVQDDMKKIKDDNSDKEQKQ